MSPAPPACDIIACPGGPFLVRGALAVYDETGAEHFVRRPVVAICRCGRSSRRPWCDGTHKMLPATVDLSHARLAEIEDARLEISYSDGEASDG